MKRRTFDRIVSFVGLGLAVFLLIAAVLLNWGYTFANDSVKTQLAQQKISFPTADNGGFKALPEENQKAILPYAGLDLTTGKQAQVYADFYIGEHVKGINNGKTYSETSAEALAASAASKAAPTDQDRKIVVQTCALPISGLCRLLYWTTCKRNQQRQDLL